MASPSAPPGLILAGGKSSRMGSNKALLALGSDTVLGHVLRRLKPQVLSVAVNASTPLPGFEGLRYLADTTPGQLGPLAGILTGMRHFGETEPEARHFLTVPCDSPLLPLHLTERLFDTRPDARTIVVASSLGRNHPVFALWPVALADDLEAWLTTDENRRINGFLSRHPTVTVDFAPVETAHGTLDPFLNINTPEDLARANLFSEVL
ncbi:molybdenum cofactor guanylyltransferase MobA [Aliirhizobium terrae]|uniref:molybdenum cofactor guanylyltransferase MobA n=1 Tax=Terrirhizobium terrae TaxID=2926709 RepID=UPI0025751C61|nr:molybdenum cofactor guanylyltransferase MobA [Rhizobium sp. CC-CFT758]WJH40161.1 molybdenum cofactor guanylyltransferase MobA [Rhizobium sp. CC-CFT758]